MEHRNGRFALIEQLRADHITYMFGNPGTVEQGFLDALEQSDGPQYMLGLQETIAVGMADGYARATKRPTVVQLHSSVGLGNGIGMIYQAYRGHAPLVILSGEAGIRYDAMDSQMAADLVAMAKPVTKWATRVLDPNCVLRILRRAIKVACTPPTGPVFVCLPMDILDAPNSEKVHPSSLPITNVAPNEEDLTEVASLLAVAKHPLFLIGDGVAFSSAQDELTQLAELVGAEVWGVDASEVNMDTTHPLFKGQFGHMFGEASQKITIQGDVILICGTYVFPEVFPALSHVFAPEAQVIHIDLNAYEIAKNFPVDRGFVSDPKTTLHKLLPLVQKQMNPRLRAAAQARLEHHHAQQHTPHTTEPSDAQQLPGAFLQELARSLPADAIIFDEALTMSPELTRYLPPRSPGHYFLTRGGSLGVGIPGALGLKLAHPDKTVLGFTGDGGSMYTIQALWTAAHHHIGAKFVICNNHSYELLKQNIAQYWQERHIPTHAFPSSFDLTTPPINFVELARSMGVQAIKVDQPEHILPAIQQALADDQPFLIDLFVPS